MYSGLHGDRYILYDIQCHCRTRYPVFLHTYATCSKLPSNISTMIESLLLTYKKSTRKRTSKELRNPLLYINLVVYFMIYLNFPHKYSACSTLYQTLYNALPHREGACFRQGRVNGGIHGTSVSPMANQGVPVYPCN